MPSGFMIVGSFVMHTDIDVHPFERALLEILTEMAQAGDAVHADRLQALLEKLRRRELVIAFCGHFSAGKSAMINHILGDHVLPSSPIPTSANVVTIRRGDQRRLLVHRDPGNDRHAATVDPREWTVENIKTMAIDGENISAIDVWMPLPDEWEHVAIVDTPGIDSTDDAHRLATESALYVADVVIYVMDYNHVQSEVNLAFTKLLSDRGKWVDIVVNQIDKHLDFELAFTDFRDETIRAFHLWGVEPHAFYFTSVADPNHPDNELPRLRQALTSMSTNREQLLREQAPRMAADVIEDFTRWLYEQSDESRQTKWAEIEAMLDQCSLPQVEQWKQATYGQDLADLRYQLDQALDYCMEQSESTRTDLANVDEAVKRLIQELVQNARLVLYSTTERAEAYIASLQPSFRVGWLRTREKTAEERSSRLQALYDDVRSQVAGNLEWHLRDLLLRLADQYGNPDEAGRLELSKWRVAWSSEDIAKLAQAGAPGSTEYIHNFTRSMDQFLKETYRRQALRTIQPFIDDWKTSGAKQLQELEKGIDCMRGIQAAADELNDLVTESDEARQRLLERIGGVQYV